MAKRSEQAKLIQKLYTKGYTNKQLAALTGRSERYITQARDSEVKVGKGGRISQGKGQNLVPALKELNTRGKLSPSNIPERRTKEVKDLSGKVIGKEKAAVRGKVAIRETKRGAKQETLTVKKAPKTVGKVIGGAISRKSYVRWTVKVKKGTTKSKMTKMNAYMTAHAFSAQELQNRINNPGPGDNWKAGDVSRALFEIALQQDSGIISARYSDLEQTDITTLDEV